jgi:hypothetical protein
MGEMHFGSLEPNCCSRSRQAGGALASRGTPAITPDTGTNRSISNHGRVKNTAALAETHEMAKKQSELILNDLILGSTCSPLMRNSPGAPA